MRKLFLKIKRFLFKKITGLNPEDIRKLVYVQIYLERNNRHIKSFNDYLKKKYESL